jgi:uncharacterized protein (DUF2461 family)
MLQEIKVLKIKAITMLTNDSLQFLGDLKANNNRDWFLENKKRYELF